MQLAELLGALKTRGFEAVSQNVTAKQVRLLGRVPQVHMNDWLVVVNSLLAKGEASTWTIDISKQYFRRNGKLLYAWRIIMQGEDVQSHYQDLGESLRTAPHAKTTVEEYTLHGVGPDRNAPRGGKGAQGVLNAVVGAAAVRR